MHNLLGLDWNEFSESAPHIETGFLSFSSEGRKRSMDLLLSEKRALVTGSSRGIGEGIVKALAQEGAAVIVHGRNDKDAKRVANDIREDGGKAFVAVGDLSTDEGAEKVADAASSLLGGVDILVNNAGVYFSRGWNDTSSEQWAEVYNANVLSMVRMIRLLTPQMKELQWGRIILVGSAFGQYPGQVVPDYSATKGATNTLTVSLTKELSGTGITINTVSPGPIATDNLDNLMLGIAKMLGWETTDMAVIKQRFLEGPMLNPTGRLGKIEEVANLVAFISSPLANFINGSNLRIDGGYVPTVN
jgi:3-oxoacyl-[acyl-carrier protein] reductase